jgi:threonine/homoserine/homoserine lactone efflux protein
MNQYLAFFGIALLVICTPGQDTALTIRNTLAGGRRSGVSTAVGVSAGQATWTLATSAGLATVIMASGPLFFAIRLAGAAYLIYLGSRSLLRAMLVRSLATEAQPPPTGRLASGTAFWQGMFSNLSNAKMVAFFISLLPQFAGPHPGFAVLVALGLIFSLLTLVWLVAYAFAVSRLGAVLRRTGIRRTMEAVLGVALLGLGLRLTAEASGWRLVSDL